MGRTNKRMQQAKPLKRSGVLGDPPGEFDRDPHCLELELECDTGPRGGCSWFATASIALPNWSKW